MNNIVSFTIIAKSNVWVVSRPFNFPTQCEENNRLTSGFFFFSFYDTRGIECGFLALMVNEEKICEKKNYIRTEMNSNDENEQ